MESGIGNNKLYHYYYICHRLAYNNKNKWEQPNVNQWGIG